MIAGTFNLSQWIAKRANYEGAQGYMQAQTRAWMNCCRDKMSGKNASAQEAWQSCLDEYQKGEGREDWVGKYAKDMAGMLKTAASRPSYARRIARKMAGGLTAQQAVLSVLARLADDSCWWCEQGFDVTASGDMARVESHGEAMHDRCSKEAENKG